MLLASVTRRFFDVRAGEERSTGLMLGHSFFMGLSTVFFETAASALFLAHYGAAALPWVYVAAAALNTLTGVAYTWIQPRTSFGRLMGGTLLFLLASTLALRVSLAISDAPWLLFAALVWYRVISILTDLEYWAVAGRLYDVRQAKRLFGFVGSGEVVARIAGAFSVPLLLGLTGVANLLVVSAIALASCSVLLRLILRLPGAQSEAEAPATLVGPRKVAGTGLVRRVLSDRYLRLIVAVAFLAVLGKYFVDFAFLGEIKGRYEDTKGLATFFGLFSGVSQTLSLATRTLISGRLLNRFGIRLGVLVLPAAHLLCTIGIVVLGLWNPASAAVFWLVIANQGVYKTLKHPIDNPTFKVLYQPLRKEQRLATQIAVETIVNPVGLGVAGAVMLLFSAVVPYDPVRFSWALLLTFGAWLYVARQAGREYGAALVRALEGRIEDIPFVFDDDEGLKILERTVQRGEPADVLFALQLLEQGDPARVGPIVLRQLDHPAAQVRMAALELLEGIGPPGALEAVRTLLKTDPVAKVRGAALRCLASLGGEAMQPELAGYLEDPEPEARHGAVIGLVRQGADFARRYVHERARSRQPERRTWAARVIGEAGYAGFEKALRRLLRDPHPEVRRTALATAGRLGVPALWPLVLRGLSHRAYCGEAANALVAGGPEVVPVLGAAFTTEVAPAVSVRLARVLGRLRGDAASALLSRRLGFPVETVRHEVLTALRQCGYRAGDAEAERVRVQVRREVGAAAQTLAWLRDLGEDSSLQLLRGALEAELRRSRDRLFLLLSLVYDAQAIQRAREHRADPSREKRAYALEILDVTLDGEMKQLALPLLDDSPGKSARLAQWFPNPPQSGAACLRAILERGSEWSTPWTQACALEAIASRADLDARDSVETILRGGTTALVRETGTKALERLAAHQTGAIPVEPERRPMHTIEKVITLRAVQMFSETSEDVLADIAAVLEEMDVEAGQLIFEKGAVGDSMYVIVDGEVRVFDAERTIVHLGPRDIFGELALLDPEPRFASIETVKPTRLLRLDREAFLELMSGNIEIVRGVLHVLCQRLRQTVQKHGAYTDSANAGGGVQEVT